MQGRYCLERRRRTGNILRLHKRRGNPDVSRKRVGNHYYGLRLVIGMDNERRIPMFEI